MTSFNYFCINKIIFFLKFYHYIFFLFIGFSCGKEAVIQPQKKVKKSEFSIAVRRHSITSIQDIFKKDVEHWEELRALGKELSRFENISANEALASASDLSDLAKSLKNSEIPSKFDKASFKARVNVFYNETLHLADINTIEDVTIHEVSTQIHKVIATYNAIITKINSVLEEERLENLINVNLDGIASDASKIDVITKKALLKKEGEKH